MTPATRNRLAALAVIVLALVVTLLWQPWSINAQTITTKATPENVNATKPESVKLEITKDGAPDTQRLGQVQRVRGGGQTVQTTKDAQGNVTFVRLQTSPEDRRLNCWVPMMWRSMMSQGSRS